MASSWPNGYDATFPGWPFNDNTEYVTADALNGMVSAIQNVEAGLGYGAGSSSLNPLYSAVFNETFSTLTARIASLEAFASALIIRLDAAAGDIAPIGATASAGATGKAADAGHVHVGVTSFNGRPGPITTTATDVTKVFPAAGGLLVGTGVGTGEILPVGAAGKVLQVGGSDPSGLMWGTVPWGSGDLRFTSALSFDQSAWLSADGSPQSRSTYPSLFTASTVSATGTTVINNNVINGLSSIATALMAVGNPVEGTNIQVGSVITSVGATSVALSKPATAGSSTTITVFPYGNGNGSSTFNLIDMRGRSPLGIDWYRSGPNNNSQPWGFMGQFGGEVLHLLLQAELASHHHTGLTDTENNVHTHGGNTTDESILHGHLPPFGQFVCTLGGGAYVLPFANTVAGLRVDYGRGNSGQFGGGCDTGEADQFHNHGYDTGTQIDSHGHTFTSDPQGSSAAHNNMHPFTVGHWLVKI